MAVSTANCINQATHELSITAAATPPVSAESLGVQTHGAPTQAKVSSSGNISATAITQAAAAIAAAEEFGLKTHAVPTELAAIQKHDYDPHNHTKPPWRIIGTLLVSLIKKKREVTLAELQIAFNILNSFSKLDPVTADAEKALHMRMILKGIMGETEQPASGPYEFPEPFPTLAAIILAKVDSDLAYEEIIEIEAPQPPPSKKRRRSGSPPTSKTTKRRRKSSSPRDSTPLITANIDGPSITKIFDNIIQIKNNNGRSYKIADMSKKRDCNVIGHNKLNVGAWWPLRICALEAGAHGAMQAGIAGGASDGTYSIVVSSAYEGMDLDKGDTILYSGSNSHNNEDPDTPVVTHATKGMRLAALQNRSIRVLRTSGSSWKGAPKAGIRYDGLYKIARENILKNRKGGAYVLFKLVRNEDQPKIDLSHPNHKEVAAFETLKG